MKKTFTVKEVCPDCKGTGIYVGFAERGGVGVVCQVCKGTGCHTFKHTYEEFTEKKERKEIHTVLETNPGWSLGGTPALRGEYGGMPYKDWAKGKPFPPKSEMRNFVCPSWWYQSADYDKKPNWTECEICCAFRDCKHFLNKAACWERFDKEQK